MVLTAILAVVVTGLGLYGYRAVREWRRSAAVLVQRSAEDAADLLVKAFVRDMRGAQALVIANLDVGDFATQPLPDFSNHVVGAFTRYPYPESFFGWRRTDGDVVFFNRPSRQPAWATGADPSDRHPLILSRNPRVAAPIFERIRQAAARSDQYAHFQIALDGVAYEIVARLGYANAHRDALTSVTGFTVNLPWVRTHYFSAVMTDVARMARPNTTLDYELLDEAGRTVAGTPLGAHSAVRTFPMQFFDPSAARVGTQGRAAPTWTVGVSAARDPVLVWAQRGADWSLLLITATVLGVLTGFLFSARAVRASASLTSMRAEFVATVTHELKTPLAGICALSDTLVRQRFDAEGIRRYALMLVRESRRLQRLIDNLLAYARVTDTTELYSFEPLAIEDIVADALGAFRHQLREGAFEVTSDDLLQLPPVRGDNSSLRLAVGNLLDNAIRYSGEDRRIHLGAGTSHGCVYLEVRDHGVGIPADEVGRVQERFVRGRHTRTHGSGLGLAIVTRVAHEHGGRFSLVSEVGVGTTARLEVPAHHAPIRHG